ncbi:uncharacterized protein [Dysidea avara]|uniref:uncharacterized protein n=1 Tax=Dysidea avara TaxID=196820 RepID=UPI0033207F9F
MTIINGRPRHSQSQGLIEKGNHLVEMQLQAFKCEHKDSNCVSWTDWLPCIQYNLNVQVCRTLKQNPYEVMFGQPPRLAPFAELPEGVDHCIMEEDLTDLIKDDDVSLLFDELPPTVFPPTSSSRMSPQQLSRSTSPPSSLMMSPRRLSRS